MYKHNEHANLDDKEANEIEEGEVDERAIYVQVKDKIEQLCDSSIHEDKADRVSPERLELERDAF